MEYSKEELSRHLAMLLSESELIDKKNKMYRNKKRKMLIKVGPEMLDKPDLINFTQNKTKAKFITRPEYYKKKPI